MFLFLGGSGGGDNKPAVSSYSDVDEIKFAVPRFWSCCLSGSAGGDSFMFLLFSKPRWPKLLETRSASNGNFPIRIVNHTASK